ncbi:MAG: DUF1669 domain-containing protein [Chloroflexi bacterium]|nr:DUF1669 domain-containing protein [Chloroflexota bacterium]MBU1747925.1 DUF1669 domain-containing protein [Chloroflexota bacterium]MBU1879239.1 DUF1669 domain-containing protein [Chloroflexota bacterium]
MKGFRQTLTLLVLALMLVSLTGVQGCEDVLSEIEVIMTIAATVEPYPTTPGTPPPSPPADSSWYSVYFNTPRYPDKDEYHYGGIEDQLVAVIDKATKSIDLAAYEFDLENVAHALVRAKGRGVTVRMVTDTDNMDEIGIEILKKAKIKVVEDDRGGIMHNKFLVIDGEWVWTGSWNLTINGTYRNNNNALIIHSPELAHNYALVFNAMFEDKEFGPGRKLDIQHQVTVNGTRIDNYFSPEEDISARLVDLIKTSKKSIHFMAFSFTDQDIARAMSDRAKDGVEVRGVFETRGSDTSYSRYDYLRRAKLDVVRDGNPYVLHHKVIIIDGEIVVTGSYNFSASANESNDENVLVLYNPEIAALFEAEFLRVYDTAQNPPK